MAAIALIVLGILLLLHTLDLLDFEYVARYWPVLLIAAGAYLLYGRLAGTPGRPRRCAMNGNDVSLVRAIRGPVTLITVGVLFALNNFTPYRFTRRGRCC